MVIKFEFGKHPQFTFNDKVVPLNFISVFLLANLFATITWMVPRENKTEWLELLQTIQDDNETKESNNE